MRKPNDTMASHPQTAVFQALSPTEARPRYRVTLKPTVVKPDIVKVPTLGEILDVLTADNSGPTIDCDPALRNSRVAGVIVRDADTWTEAGAPPQGADSGKRPTRIPAQV